jgi:hypothetical protein
MDEVKDNCDIIHERDTKSRLYKDNSRMRRTMVGDKCRISNWLFYRNSDYKVTTVSKVKLGKVMTLAGTD